MTHLPTRRARFPFIALLTVAGSCRSAAQPALPMQTAPRTGIADPRYQSAIDSAAKLVAALTTGSPAISVAVAVGPAIVWSAAFGFSDLERSIPATPSSRFRAYSLSKGLTATAAIALRDQGRLDLDAPIQRYLPDFPNPQAKITTRLLAGHLAGVRHYRGNEALWTRSCQTIQEAIDVFKSDPLEHQPGTTYSYSSWGYVLLSGVVSAAAGAPYADVVGRLVLAPAGMTATGLENAGSNQDLVAFYEPSGKSVKPARKVDNSCKWGAGGYVTTAEDMARFGAALLGGRIVASASVNEMLTSMRTTSGAPTDYGMGFGVATDSLGKRRAAHSGSAIGGRAAMFMLPDAGIVVVLLSNIEGERLTGPAGSIARLFRGR